MKVAQVSALPHSIAGGSQGYCYELSKRLSTNGCQITMYTSSLGGFCGETFSPNFKVVTCPTFGFMPPNNPISFVINDLIKDPASVVHAHSYIFLTSFQVALMRKLISKSFVLHLHGGLSYVPVNSGLSWRFLNWLKIHAYDPTLGSLMFQSADAVLSVSRGDLATVSQLFGVDEDKLVWVPNAVDTDYFRPDRKTVNSVPSVAFIGRLEPWKGVRMFLHLVRDFETKHGEASFIVAGTGSMAGEVRAFADGHDLLTYLGPLSRSHVRDLLNRIDILVIPSYVEGLPSILLEAMATEVPVVAASVGGIPELVSDGNNGFLFDPNDENELFSIVWRLANDFKLRRELGRRGRLNLMGNYEWKNVVSRVLNVYCQVTS